MKHAYKLTASLSSILVSLLGLSALSKGRTVPDVLAFALLSGSCYYLARTNKGWP